MKLAEERSRLRPLPEPCYPAAEDAWVRVAAKRYLKLPAALGILDRFDAVILDDIGYVQQSREEMEVLFTFLAERYEKKSVVITPNLVFSQWDQIFKDPMTNVSLRQCTRHPLTARAVGKGVKNLDD